MDKRIGIRVPYYEKEKVKKKYSSFLKNKRIVIVGPSSLLIGNNQGEFIDSFDVVIRQSRSYIVPDSLIKDMGSRTDIIFSSLHDVYDKGHLGTGKYFPFSKLSKTLKWFAMSAPNVGLRIKRFKREINKTDIPVYVVDHKWRTQMHNILNRSPSNGIISLCDTIRYDVKEIYVTGFTFYKVTDSNGWHYYKDYKPDPTKNKGKGKGHNFEKEFLYFKDQVIKNREKVKCDDILEQLLDL